MSDRTIDNYISAMSSSKTMDYYKQASNASKQHCKVHCDSHASSSSWRPWGDGKSENPARLHGKQRHAGPRRLP